MAGMDIYLRFGAGLVLLVLFTRWLSRKLDPGFGYGALLTALGIKVACGIVYGYLFLHVYGGDDTWLINRDSMVETAILKHTPAMYFNDLDLPRLVREYGWIQGLGEFKDKLEWAMITKPLSLVNFASDGDYYVNLLAFTAFSFWGPFLFFQLLRKTWPQYGNVFFWLVFAYVPVVFWLSGIRGDGRDFVFIAAALYCFDRYYREGRRGAFWLALLCVGLLAVTRTAFALVLAIGLLAWWMARRQPQRPWLSFVVVPVAAILVFFTSAWLPDPFNGPSGVVARQAAFMELKGNTRLELNRLKPNPGSFLQTAPQAFGNVWLHPLPWQAGGVLQWLMLLQNAVIIGLFLAAAWWLLPGRQAVKRMPLFYFFLFFALFCSFSIGFTVPFPGAIVRYRTVAELFLLCTGMLLVLPALRSNNNLFNIYEGK